MEMQYKYYLMRHGESLANKLGLIVSHPNNAIENYGLTVRGADQVTSAALSTRLGVNTLIVTSDYKRAIDTAEIVHSVIGCNEALIVEPLLRERNFGRLELTEHTNYEQVWEHDAARPNVRKNDVELIDEVLNRGMKSIIKLEEAYHGRKILMVGHGDVMQIILSHFQGIHPRFHRTISSMANADIRSISGTNIVRSPAA